MIVKKLVLASFLAVSAVGMGCASGDNTETANGNAANTNSAAATGGTPHREGLIDTNTNMSGRENANTVSTNTAVVTNNNGNDNTAGVSTMDEKGHKDPSKKGAGDH